MLIFVVVLVALIVVHELGHLVVAKWSGMRVDEFGIGYPPRAALLGKIGETEITLNWLPLGGFVKIYGEDPSMTEAPDPRAFHEKNRAKQAAVLLAGVVMNVVLAFVLLVSVLAIGTPRAVSDADLATAKNIHVVVADVLPGSPGASAGLMPGDIILSGMDSSRNWAIGAGADAKAFTNFIATSGGREIHLQVERAGSRITLNVTPAPGVVAEDPSREAIGVSVGNIGVLHVSFLQAISQGAVLTWALMQATASGLWHLFVGIFTFHADLSNISGPIGIANAVGDAAHTGFGDLLYLAALISINLAFVNLIPVPALDGGRLLFVIIESVTRRRINPKIANSLTAISFVLLLLLMAVVTVHDIIR